MTGTAAPVTDRARRYDAWFDGRWGRYAWRIESEAVLAALGSVGGRTVADIGCGTGRLLQMLVSLGARAVGIDSDPGVLALAATRGQVIRADAHRLPLADGRADAAVSVATLEFTARPERVLAEMARIVRPGGLLVAGALNPGSPWGALDRPAGRDPYRDGCFLPRADLLALGGRYGRAEIRGVLYAAGRLPALSRTGPALELLGCLAPRYGAFQVLTVTTGRHG